MLISTTEAAQLLGVARITVIKWITRGHLPAVKVGRDWVIKRADLEAMQPRTTGRPPKKDEPIS